MLVLAVYWLVHSFPPPNSHRLSLVRLLIQILHGIFYTQRSAVADRIEVGHVMKLQGKCECIIHASSHGALWAERTQGVCAEHNLFKRDVNCH